MGYRCEHFHIKELVAPEIYNLRGERCWELFRTPLLIEIDAIRDKFGPVYINDWYKGGGFKYSGLRPFDCPIGSEFSQHKFGAAFDLKFKNVSPVEVFEHILEHSEHFPGITAMEDAHQTKTWLHVDCRNHELPEIWVLNP